MMALVLLLCRLDLVGLKQHHQQDPGEHAAAPPPSCDACSGRSPGETELHDHHHSLDVHVHTPSTSRPAKEAGPTDQDDIDEEEAMV